MNNKSISHVGRLQILAQLKHFIIIAIYKSTKKKEFKIKGYQ